MEILPGYASVGLEEIVDPKFNDIELDIQGGDGERTLSDALHSIILWPKRYIIIPNMPPPIPLSVAEQQPLSPRPSTIPPSVAEQ
jgi:hypothetical protein